MTPGTSPDRRAELRLPVYGKVSLLIENSAISAPAELIDVSLCGFHVRCHHLPLAPSLVIRLQHPPEDARVRAIWSREIDSVTESGLLREEPYFIRCLRAGEGESLLQLVGPYLRSVRATLRSILRNREDAEDVLQECLIKVVAHIDQFHPGQSFRAWLLQIATNEALKYVRDSRKHRHTVLLDAGAEDEEGLAAFAFPDLRPSPFETLEQHDFRRALWRALQSLDSMYRDVFVLRHLRHLGTAEIAGRLNINVETANTRLHRARLRLRQDLMHHYPLSSAGTGRLVGKHGPGPHQPPD